MFTNLVELPRPSINIMVQTKRFIDGIEILDEVILYQKGCFKRVKRWLRGRHPHLGILIQGYTGIETVVESDVIVPMATFEVVDK